MTTPTPLEPSKKKAWVSVIGGMVGAAVPLLLQLAGVLPAPYGPLLAGILGVIALITGKTVEQVPYLPPGTVVAPAPAVPPAGDPGDPWAR